MNVLKRLFVYFTVMFPLHVYGIITILMFASFFMLVQTIETGRFLFYRESLFGMATIFLSFLLMRLFDELKDRDIDPLLFPDRPLVTGRVKYIDVKVLILISIFIVIAINLDKGPVTSVYFVYFIYLMLSWQWWLFPEQVSNNLTLLTITHQPLIPLKYVYIYTVYIYVTRSEPNFLLAAVLCILYTLPFLAWEISRKTRAATDEDEYLTYSKRWGSRKAAALPFLYILIACSGFSCIGIYYKFSLYYIMFNIIIGLFATVLILRFIISPVTKNNILKPVVEVYSLLFQLSIVLEALRRGNIL